MQNSNILKHIFRALLLGALFFVAVGCGKNADQSSSVALTPTPSTEATPTPAGSTPTPTKTSASGLVEPISGGVSRITKKGFGLKVSPGNSPVSPEKFSGYHTGVDFETTADEANADVKIFAICTGPLVLKKTATGYGGVAVQQCTINGQTDTVIYGHLKIGSVTAAQGSTLKAGDALGILGKGYSTETDGERKHLHLGIHKGSTVNILGYVQKQSDLSQWIDFRTLVQ